MNMIVKCSRVHIFILEVKTMTKRTIKVLKVEPHKRPEQVYLHTDLDSLQKAVSIGCDAQGLIEIIPIERGVCLLCNDEGKLLGLEGNRRFGNDILTGVFYVTQYALSIKAFLHFLGLMPNT